MNKPLSTEELVACLTITLTRHDKLMRFAKIIRSGPRVPLYIFNDLEYYDQETWDRLEHPGSAFALAAKDSILREAGLTRETVGAAQRFFELSRDDLHEFSCDCGGSISHEEMADRIEQIAARAA